MAADVQKIGEPAGRSGICTVHYPEKFAPAVTKARTCRSSKTLGGTGVRITLLVDDADRVVERAVAAGARVNMLVEDMFWGGRYGKIVDPFGHEWGINQQVKEQSHEETQIAAHDFFAKRK
jgi:uncharacterized glyoxalase superfamily protein PhnB